MTQVFTICSSLTTTACGAHLVPCTASLSGARDASLMDGVSGTMAQLGRWPVWPRRGRECMKLLHIFRIVSLAETDVACESPCRRLPF